MDFPAIIAISVPAALAAGTIAAWWTAIVPRAALLFLFTSLLAGQLLRLPLPGQGGGLLVSDVAVLFVLLAGTIRFFLQNRVYNFSNKSLSRGTGYGLLVTPFLLWSLFNLVLYAPSLEAGGIAIAVSYWLRLAAHLLLLPALLTLFQDFRLHQFTRRALLVTIITLSSVGFAQLFIFPNLESVGWDPHMGRLVATWLDPNFIGAFFALALVWLGFQLLRHGVSSRWRWILGATACVTVLALIGTQSRSSFLALAAALAFCSPFLLVHLLSFARNKAAGAMKVGSIGLLLFAGACLGALVLGQRFSAAFIDDPTVALRVTSLQAVWQLLATKTAVIGTGYNAYQFAAVDEGLTSSFMVHSRAGADNSLLTLWVTTGVLGVILFLLPWAYGSLLAWRQAWRNKNISYMAPMVAFITLLAHAQFVNSFLYGHLLITLAVIFALSKADPGDIKV